jgi:hypothetical protein
MKNSTYIKKLFGSQGTRIIKEEFEYDNQKQMDESDYMRSAVFLHSTPPEFLRRNELEEETFNSFVMVLRHCISRQIVIFK